MFEEPVTKRKLAIICSKGNLDMAYPGLVLANAALGEGVETHLFFTFWGFDIITKSRMAELKFTPLGNTATHLPQGLGGLPGMTALATHQMRKQIAAVGVPDVPQGRVDKAFGLVSRVWRGEDVDVEGGFVAGAVDVGAAGLVFGDGAFDDAGADA